MAENFLDLILTNFPSFKLNALLRPGRLFHNFSNGLGFISKNHFLHTFFSSKNRKITDIHPTLP